jgi:hypothetical protein
MRLPGLGDLLARICATAWRAVDDALDHHLDLSAAFLPAEQARLDHLGVVENQQIAGFDQFRQVGESAVVSAPG